MGYDEKLAERVRTVLAERPGVTEKRVMGTLAFMVNGSMCCSVGGDCLLVRVHAEARERLLSDPFVSPMRLGSRTMKGFVRVALESVQTRARVAKWVERGIACAAARKAKGVSRSAAKARTR